MPCSASLSRLLDSPRHMLALAALASGAALSFALIAQYVFLLHPCHMCILQRYPYAAVIVLGAGGFLAAKKTPRLALPLLALCATLFLIGAGTAATHGAMERGFIATPEGCASDSSDSESIEDLRRKILNAPLVTCDQPMAKVFGLSMAEWNALVYLFLTLMSSYVIWRNLHSPAVSA